MTHAYPRDLAVFVMNRWEVAPEEDQEEASREVCLPELDRFEEILSTCYQASLLREEERPVTFRLILSRPSRFAEESGPPVGFHRLVFSRPRPFTPDELRRLSPAADFHRALIGVELDEEGQPRIWGLVSSGPRWVQAAQGGRARSVPLPQCLVVCATSPGRVVVCNGSTTVATLHNGCITCPTLDVFGASWLWDTFADVRDEVRALHEEAVAGDGPRRPLDPKFIAQIGQHVIRRALSVVRAARHGATLLFLPPETADRCELQSLLKIKYRFRDDEARRRFRSLILRILDAVTRVGPADASTPAGWEDFVDSRDERLAELDEGIFELGHLLAGLSAVDGAVVLTKRFEILGFGAEISGLLPDVAEVARAGDAEGRERVTESVASVGTRHRSVYRLSGKLPDMMGIVVSQDGGVRFVRHMDGQVTYWDQAAVGSRDI